VIALSLPDKPTHLRHDDLLSIVAELYGLRLRDLRGRSRLAIIARGRRVVCFIAHEDMGLSHRAVGQLLGGMHYSSSVHHVTRARELLETDSRFRLEVEYVRGCLRGTGSNQGD